MMKSYKAIVLVIILHVPHELNWIPQVKNKSFQIDFL